MCATFDAWMTFQFNFPFKDQFQTCTAGHRCTKGKGLQTSHLCLIHIWAQYSLMWKCIWPAGRLHQYDSQSKTDRNILIISFLMTLFTQAQIRRANWFIQNICSENQSHWPISSLKADWIDRLYWTCLFEVWQHKTQDSFMEQTKQDKTVQMIHNVICQQFLFGWHLLIQGSTLSLPFIDQPLVLKHPNNTASVY